MKVDGFGTLWTNIWAEIITSNYDLRCIYVVYDTLTILGTWGRHIGNYWGPCIAARRFPCLHILVQRPALQTDSFPRGSKYPILKDSGPKSHLGYGPWDQSP